MIETAQKLRDGYNQGLFLSHTVKGPLRDGPFKAQRGQRCCHPRCYQTQNTHRKSFIQTPAFPQCRDTSGSRHHAMEQHPALCWLLSGRIWLGSRDGGSKCQPSVSRGN